VLEDEVGGDVEAGAGLLGLGLGHGGHAPFSVSSAARMVSSQ
jgi:hypothetical protein